MIREVRVPEVAENVHEGKVTTVLVSVGDTVEADQSLMELETEKAVVALPAPFAGRVTEIRVSEGDTVQIGDVIVKLETEPEAPEAEAKPKQAEPPQKAAAAKARKAAGGAEGTTGSTAERRTGEPGAKAEAPRGQEPGAAAGGEGGRDEGGRGEAGDGEAEEGEEPEAAEEGEAERPRAEGEHHSPRAAAEERPAGERGAGERRARPEQPEPVRPLLRRPPPAEHADEGERETPGIKVPVRSAGAAPALARRPSETTPAAASPTIRRLARQLGVEIHRVRGSGPHGRIGDEDVRRYVRDHMTADAASPAVAGWAEAPPVELPDFSKWGETSREPLSQVRQITAETVARAWATIPQVTQHDNADITELERFRREHNAHLAEGEAKLTVTAILVKVCASALLEFPRFNASLDVPRRELVLKHYVNIAVAVDTDRGLLVPVVRDADKKGLARIAAEVAGLAERARDKRITTDEMRGGNFTISNLGGIGGTSFNPIVFPPQVAILGASEAAHQPVHRNGKLVARLILPLALTYDHRVVDGADGARFLRWITETLSHPWQMLLKD